MLEPQNTLSLEKHDYTLLEEVAYGGQSVIWKAQRHSDGEWVALKTVLIYDPSVGGSRNAGQPSSTRTLRTSTEIQELIRLAEEEIRFLDSLGKEAKNYHIATFEDKGSITLNDRPDRQPLKIPMVAMSLYRYDLRHYEAKYADAQSKPRFTVKQLLRWIQQIAAALDFIHQFSQKNTHSSTSPYRASQVDQPPPIYVHRDIKPANIMIDQVGDAWLIDFGIVRAADNVLTSTVMASYLYCAPEQRLAQQFESSGGRKYAITPAVDIYSLAVVICRLLGDLPKAQDKINLQRTIDEHENQLRNLSQNTHSNGNSHGILGQIGGLTEQEQANLIRQFESVLKNSSSDIRLDEHRCLPYTAYSVISQAFVHFIQQMLNPNYQSRPNAQAVMTWAQSLYDALHPTAAANDFIFRPVRPKVTLDQTIDCHLRFSGVGLVTPFTWLALKVNNRRYDFSAIEPRMRLNHHAIQNTLLEKNQTYHLSFPLLLPKTGKYQLTLTAYVGDVVIEKETTCEVIHSAEQLWQQGNKVEALRQDLREVWLDDYRDEILRKHQRDKPLQKSMALYKAYQQLTDVHKTNPLLLAHIDAAENMEFPETTTKSTWFGFRKRTPKSTDRAAPLVTEKVRWLDDNGETLVDSKTGLMWQKYSLGRSKENPLAKLTDYSWHEAMQQALQNTCGNHHDWRLPTQQELCSVNPSTLKSLEKTLYWTASQVPQPLSSYEASESKVIVVDFGLGTQVEKLTENKEDLYASVYLVRDAPRDDPEAFKTYKANAENTQQDQNINCCAQYQLALCYLHGLGNERENPQLAYEWFEQAAEMGHAHAQYQLSGFYQQGKWVDSDHEKAYEWCRKAAEQGYAAAQSQLAWWYQQGFADLLETDSKKAFFWYKQAADQGQTYAQSCVASCYFSGLGTAKHPQKAFHYAKQAAEPKKPAEKGDKNAQYILGMLYMERCKVTYYNSYGDQPTPAKPSDAFAYFQQAAGQQQAAAAYNLAYCYLTGFGVEKNAEESFKWYQSAAEYGESQAKTMLGHLYANGIGTERNEAKALQAYQQAADAGHAEAQRLLGMITQYGLCGSVANATGAFHWYHKAAVQADPIAQYYLAWIYAEGLFGVDQDLATALDYYSKAAEQGHAASQNNLGRLLSDRDFPTNKAYHYYQQAAEQGHYAAYNNLACLILDDTLQANQDSSMNDTTPQQQAVGYLSKAADAGQTIAQYNLARLYDQGRYIEQSTENAAHYYQHIITAITRSAVHRVEHHSAHQTSDELFAEANYALAELYYHKADHSVDTRKVKRYYENAADKGHSKAQSHLAGECLSDATQESWRFALTYYQKAAQQGDAEAQNNLGVMYCQGLAVKQDNTKAVEWFAQAADQQFPLALTNLGVLYAQGFGVAHHIEKALGYYEQAAALQEAAALCYLGLLSEQGRGLVHDDEQAVDYYQQASAQADPIAQYCLGRMYQQGLGYLEQDQQQAEAYYRQSAKQHSAAAQVGLAYLLYEQAAQTQSQSQSQPQSQSTQEAEKHGSKFAQLSITNLTAIRKLYRQAAEKHHPVAQTLLATLYRDGISEPKTLPSAQDWYNKAAKQGNAIAQVCLGWLYEQRAKSTPSSLNSTTKEMVSCYTQAAEQNNRVAQTYLAALYEVGKGVEKDPKTAFQWYTKAAAQQDVVAQNRLGELYEAGLGTETDIPQALYWYRQTLQHDQTYEKAYTNLGRLVWQHYPHLLGDEIDHDTLSEDD